MKTYFNTEYTTLYHGDSVSVLNQMPRESVQCVVTSPPYWNMRNYGFPGQIGTEDDFRDYIDNLREIFKGLWRVLRADGTVWLNIGDTYAGGGGIDGVPEDWDSISTKNRGKYVKGHNKKNPSDYGLKKKDLIGIPWRVALALQDDGWYLRSDTIWAKGISLCDSYSGSCMPESVTDRPTKSHEHVFLLTKSAKYHYDHVAVRENGEHPAGTKAAKGSSERLSEEGVNARPTEYATYSGSRNIRSVWTVNPARCSDAHFAKMPRRLASVCIRASTSPYVCAKCGTPWGRGEDDELIPSCSHNDKSGYSVVLDPFCGTGTTCVEALYQGHKTVGIDGSEKYIEMTRENVENPDRKRRERDMMASFFD